MVMLVYQRVTHGGKHPLPVTFSLIQREIHWKFEVESGFYQDFMKKICQEHLTQLHGDIVAFAISRAYFRI